jgi:hypothetical protein
MAMTFSDEERARILAEARRNVAELHQDDRTARIARQVQAEVFEDPVAKWRREADELSARRAAFEAERHRREREQREAAMTQTKAESDAAWEAWLAARLEQDWEYRRDILAAVVAEERKNYRAEIRRQIGDAIRELRAELNEQRARDAGQIIDMPSPLIRKVHNGKAA